MLDSLLLIAFSSSDQISRSEWGSICFPLDLSSIQLAHGCWDPPRPSDWAVHLPGAWPWVWQWEGALLLWVYCCLMPWLKGFEQGCFEFFLLYPPLVSPQNLGSKLCFWFLGKQGNLWSPVAESIPLDKTYSIATDNVTWGWPSFSHSPRHLEKIIFSFSLRFPVSKICSKLNMLCYSSRSFNAIPSWNLLAIGTSPPLLLLGFLFTKTLAVQWGVPDDWIWNVYSLESSEVGAWGKKKCHHAVLEKFSSIRGKRSVILRRKNEKTYHVPRGSFVAVVYFNAHVNQRILLGTLHVLEWCSRGDKNRWCSTVDQIF